MVEEEIGAGSWEKVIQRSPFVRVHIQAKTGRVKAETWVDCKAR